MNSMTFSLLANNNPEVDGNQISFRTIDFQPHRPNLTPVSANLDQEMDLTIESLNFRIGSLGSIRLSDPAKLDPSASETKTIAMSESSVGSSSEVNSPVSFATAENIGEKIEELDKTMENLDLEDQLEDFMICYDDTSDKSTDTWKIGLELHEDEETTFSSSSSKFDNRYQVFAIVGDNSEELDDNNNPVLNPANINRGANHLAEGDTAESLANREKIRLSAEEWNTIKAAVEDGAAITMDASKNMLLGYHYALQKQSKQLARERSKIQKREGFSHCSNIAFHKARSDASYTQGVFGQFPCKWTFSHRCSWMKVYVFCRNAQSKPHSDPRDVCTLSLLYQLPNCNLFTQHALFILWRDITGELWTPVQFPLHSFTVYFTCTVYFLALLSSFYHSIRSFLYLQQTGEIDNLIVSWEQSTCLCCVQVSRCY
jgi:hypothetical protein